MTPPNSETFYRLLLVSVTVCALTGAPQSTLAAATLQAPVASSVLAAPGMTAALVAEAATTLEQLQRQQLQRFPQPPSSTLDADCAGRFSPSKYGEHAAQLGLHCVAMVRERYSHQIEQWRRLKDAIAILSESVSRRTLDRAQWGTQCTQAVKRTLTDVPVELSTRGLDDCKRALDTAYLASTADLQKRFDEARGKVDAAVVRLSGQANVTQVCSDVLKPLGQGHLREAELRDYCVRRITDRLTQLNMTASGGDKPTAQCGNLFQSEAYNSAAITCVVRWFMSNPGCKGDKCRAEIAVGNTKLWVHPPVLGEEVVLIPQKDGMFRSANRLAIDVSINRPRKLDMQLRFTTEGGRLTDIIAKSVKREEAAAAVGLQIGEAVVVVAASAVPGLGDVTGALMPIVDQVANHFMSERFAKKHRAAIESDDAVSATAVASALAAAYNTVYRYSPGRTNFVTHVCFEAGSSDGKYTGFLKETPKNGGLAFGRRCRDDERWEVWSVKHRDGALRDGDEVYLRSHDGGWLSADAGGERSPGVLFGQFPTGAAARSMIWQVVSGDGGQIIDGAAVVGTVGRHMNRITNDECLLPLRAGNSCAVNVRLRAVRHMQWLDVRPDNQHASAVLGLFTKSHVGLRTDWSQGAESGDSYAGYFAMHRWYGSGACTQGERVRDVNCLPASAGPNVDYQSGY